MNDALKAYLVEKFALPTDADEASVRKLAAEKLASGEISTEKYLELLTPKAAEVSPLDKLASLLAAKMAPAAPAAVAPTDAAVLAKAAELVKANNLGQTGAPDSTVDTAKLFAPAAAAAADKSGTVRVKRASEGYDSTKARKVYPKHFVKNGVEIPHPFGGQDLTIEGVAAYGQSDAERAKSGAYQRLMLQKALGVQLMTDHDWDLVNEAVREDKWVGDIFGSENTNEYQKPKQLSSLHQKTLLNDSTSGGQNLLPYYFDMDLVTYPKLFGELFPFVDLRDLDSLAQVKTPTLANLTVSAGPAEGDSPGITLQTTTSLSTILTSNVLNATGAITIGRDLMSDSPLKLQDALMGSYQRVLMNFLDQGIAAGDGTTFILGIFNTSSTKTYTAANNTAGPVKVSDINSMIKALPLEYRNKNAGDVMICWLSTDALYFRIKGIVTGLSGDQRLVYGYELEKYMLQTRPYKITDSSSVAGSQLAFGRMDKYRMWRRKGMTFEVSTQGKTLMLANEALITMRSRWAGQVVDPNAWVLGSGFSLQ